MKREYSSPVMEVEVFEASEYISSCIEGGEPNSKEYKLWEERNGVPGFQPYKDKDNDIQDDKVWTDRFCTERHTGISSTISNPLSGYLVKNNTEHGRVTFYHINDGTNNGKHVHVFSNPIGNIISNASQ